MTSPGTSRCRSRELIVPSPELPGVAFQQPEDLSSAITSIGTGSRRIASSSLAGPRSPDREPPSTMIDRNRLTPSPLGGESDRFIAYSLTC